MHTEPAAATASCCEMHRAVPSALRSARTTFDGQSRTHESTRFRRHQKTVAIIRALDGTWHRPFTTLELAAPQSLIEPEEYLLLDGMSDCVWREHIDNLVPPEAACAIGEVMGTTLLLTRAGETFVLGSTPIWVRNVALALTMQCEGM